MATSRNLFEKNKDGIYERVGTTLPEGYEKLGPEYGQQPNETTEQAKARQLAAYQNIQPVGKIGTSGSYLMGKKIGQPAETNPPVEEKPPAIASEQADIFNSLLKDILVKRQGIDLAGLRKTQREAQLRNISQQQAPIGESMKGLNPEQIGSIRLAQERAMEPELLKAKADLEKAQEQASNFENMYSKAAELGQEFIKNMVAPDSVVQSYKHWIEARPGDFEEILSSNKINDKTKEAIFKVLDWSAIKEAEKEELNTGIVGEYQFYAKQEKAGGKIPMSFNDYQTFDTNRKNASQKSTSDALTAGQTQTTLNQIISQFDNEPVVKSYNITAEGYQFAKGLENKTEITNTDDLGLLYAFAKAMNPAGILREGMISTIQEYAQSWATAFGFKVERIFSNEKFLSQSAVANMIATIKSRYDITEKNYKNIENEYNRRISDAKKGVVSGSITNYGQAFDNSEQFNSSNITNEQLKNATW